MESLRGFAVGVTLRDQISGTYPTLPLQERLSNPMELDRPIVPASYPPPINAINGIRFTLTVGLLRLLDLLGDDCPLDGTLDDRVARALSL